MKASLLWERSKALASALPIRDGATVPLRRECYLAGAIYGLVVGLVPLVIALLIGYSGPLFFAAFF